MTAKLTGPACRAGRALLGWSMRDLREASGVSLPTIQNIEAGGEFQAATAAKIIEAFARHSVELVNGRGTGARLVLGDAGAAPALHAVTWRVEPARRHGEFWTAYCSLPGRHAPLFESRAGVDAWAAAMGLVQSDVDPDEWFEP